MASQLLMMVALHASTSVSRVCHGVTQAVEADCPTVVGDAAAAPRRHTSRGAVPTSTDAPTALTTQVLYEQLKRIASHRLNLQLCHVKVLSCLCPTIVGPWLYMLSLSVFSTRVPVLGLPYMGIMVTFLTHTVEVPGPLCGVSTVGRPSGRPGDPARTNHCSLSEALANSLALRAP